jgi:hypothetical protein
VAKIKPKIAGEACFPPLSGDSAGETCRDPFIAAYVILGLPVLFLQPELVDGEEENYSR